MNPHDKLSCAKSTFGYNPQDRVSVQYDFVHPASWRYHLTHSWIGVFLRSAAKFHATKDDLKGHTRTRNRRSSI